MYRELSENGVRAALPAHLRDLPLILYEETDSTNTQAKLRAMDGARHGTAVIAGHQTAGRGRLGRKFYSPAGTGLYMSVVLRPQSAESAQRATIVAAGAVCRAIEHVTGRAPGIKWVNDLFLDGKKVCGILAEAVAPVQNGVPAAIVVGVGINCAPSVFPGELRDIAGSLGMTEDCRAELAAAVIRELLTPCFDVLAEYRRRSLMPGREVHFVLEGETVYATALGIDEDGGLVVRRTDGETRILRCGEVSVRF